MTELDPYPGNQALCRTRPALIVLNMIQRSNQVRLYAAHGGGGD
jgi:hypothetical protein